MADVYGVLSVRLTDSFGVIAPHELYIKMADTTTLAQVVTSAQAYFALLDPVTDAAGVIARVTLKFASTGLKTSTSVENNIGHGGLATFGDGSTGDKFSVLVPAIAEALTEDNFIDTSDADFTAWQTWLRTNATQIAVVSKAKNALTGFLASKIVTRKHRKSESKVSYKVE